MWFDSVVSRPVQSRVMMSRSTHPIPATRRIDFIALAAVLIAALALRLYGLNWDRGYYLHPDELHVADVASSRISLDWPPNWSNLLDPDHSHYNPRAIDPNSGQPTNYAYGALPIIVMTGHGDVSLAVDAMKAGAADFLEKPVDDALLMRAIEAAVGKTRKAPVDDAETGRLRERFAALSPRERDVLSGVVAGKPNKIIAYELGISPRTVEVYRAGLMSKTGAGSLSELVRMTLTLGL